MVKPNGSEKKPTESLILAAARDVFAEDGKHGARMQKIADRAGINKSLLHYYFRNKETLFEAAATDVIRKFAVPVMGNTFSGNADIYEKIEAFVSNYIDLLIENPFIPGFIIGELNRKSDANSNLTIVEQYEELPISFVHTLKEAIEAGKIKPTDPTQLIVNIVSLTVFPFIAQPILKQLFFKGNQHKLNEYMLKRKTEVYNFIVSAIKPDSV